MDLAVADLCAKHLGREARVSDGKSYMTGMLEDLAFVMEATDCERCVSHVTVTFYSGSVTFLLDATVELL